MNDLPNIVQQVAEEKPDLWAAFNELGKTLAESGPLDPRTQRLIKISMAIGAGLEGAAHSHCRKALEAGCSPEDLRHVAVLSTPTIGFPTMMRAKSWVEDVVAKQDDAS